MDLTTTDFSWVVDAIVGLIIVVSAYLAMARGFIREAYALGSWVVAFFVAFILAPAFKPAVQSIPVVGDFLKDCQMSLLAAFLLAFALALMVSTLLAWTFRGYIRDTVISLVDQILGLVYGAVRGLVLVAVVYLLFQMLVPRYDSYKMIEEAATIGLVRTASKEIEANLPNEAPGWLVGRVNSLLDECEEPG